MAETNAELLLRSYDAFSKGEVSTALSIMATDITWHVPGRSPLSGDYKGHDDVLDFFGKCMELSDGTIRIDVDQILCDGARAVALCTVSAQRNGQSWSSPEIHVWRVVDGKAVDFHEFQGDQQTEDEFWSA